MDFRLGKYLALLTELKRSEFNALGYLDYLEKRPQKFVILRHDVDTRPDLALKMAHEESKIDIKSTYYFRIKKCSNSPKVIQQIAGMGHEIGYHYEDYSLEKGDHDKAIRSFEKNLAYFRMFYPIKTICMHGSPISKWDNRMLWQHYDYHTYEILAEPYFDIDKDQIFYLTDTGRRWSGDNFSIRDRISSSPNRVYRTTSDIINACKLGDLPEKIMMTTHPQRWSTNFIDWSIELVMQNSKNLIKRRLAKLR